jgi:hypothetical protein
MWSYAPLLDESGNLYVRTVEGIAKVDPAGRLAAAFGTNGHAQTPWIQDGRGTFVRDASGSLVLLGPRAEAVPSAVSKLDRDGKLVPTFGDGGMVRFPLLPYPDFSIAETVATDARGNIFVGGRAAHSSAAFVVKLDPDGRTASGFGVAGFWTAPPICGISPQAIVFDAVGKMLVGCGGVIFRLDEFGNLDPTWGLLGAATPLGNQGPNGAGNVTSLLVASNGEIFAAGIVGAATPCTDFIIARLDDRGAPVSGFGIQGRVTVDVASRDGVTNVAMDGSGRLYVSGLSIPGCTTSTPVADATFSVTRLR